MVSRVGSDTWLSTAEFFRASLPDDQLPGGRGGPDEQARYYREEHPPIQGVHEPAWLARRAVDRKRGQKQGPEMGGRDTIDMWHREDTQPAGLPQITIGRRPLPPSVDAIAVCKTRTKDIEHRTWATYAEIRALNDIHQYYIDHPNEFRHIPVPRVYTHSFQLPEASLAFNRREQGFIIMEHIKDNRVLIASFPNGDHGWTRRQKRRFVRKMALIRLQLFFIRNNQKGVEPPIQERGMLSTTINKKAGKTAGGPTFWEASFNPPYPNNRAWVQAHLSREYTYWEAVVNNDHLHHLLPEVIPGGYDPDGWFRDFRSLQTALQDREVHAFRSEPFHVLTHDKLSSHDGSILMKGKKINCIVDWDQSGYLPISENIKDIFRQYEGAGLADPEEWIDDAEPFSKSGFYGWKWRDWIENMRINKWQLEINWNLQQADQQPDPARRIDFKDRFNWYGRITPNDFRYGDKYADQDLNESDGSFQGSKFRRTVVVESAEDVSYVNNQRRAVTNDPDLRWWHGPVMYLVNDYVRTHLGYSPTWSWQDPVIEDWARRSIYFGENLGLH